MVVLGLMGLSLALFSVGIVRLIRRIRIGVKPAPQPLRMLSAARDLLFQPALFARFDVGLMHLLLVWCLVLYLPRTIELCGSLMNPDYLVFATSTALRALYVPLREFVAVLLLLVIGYALARRWALKPAYLRRPKRSEFVLFLLALAVCSDLLQIACSFALLKEHHPDFELTVIGLPLAQLFGSTGVTWAAARFLVEATVWSHVLGIMVLFTWLPWSTETHILTAVPGLAAATGEKARVVVHSELEPVAATDLHHLPRKTLIDALNCTSCGRCDARCPAVSVGGKLSPASLMNSIQEALAGRPYPAGQLAAAVGLDAIWECTTCGLCEDACPLCIDIVNPIVNWRRSLVVSAEAVPLPVRNALDNHERSGGPLPISEASSVSPDPPAPLFDPDSCDWLLYMGCLARFDPSERDRLEAVVRLLSVAGLKFGILSTDPCCGYTLSRAGAETAFSLQADALANAFRTAGATRIITMCAHGHHQLTREYGARLKGLEIRYYLELLDMALKDGSLKFTEPVNREITYHDPCHLVHSGPSPEVIRNLLDSVAGLQRVELVSSGHNTQCCGSGGTRNLHSDARIAIAERRLAGATALGVDWLVTGCGFCRQAFQTAAATRFVRRPEQILDISEVLISALPVSTLTLGPTENK